MCLFSGIQSDAISVVNCNLDTLCIVFFVPPFSGFIKTFHTQVPFQLKLGIVTTLTAGLGMLPRALKGGRYTPVSNNGKDILVLFCEVLPVVCNVSRLLTEYFRDVIQPS